MKRKSCDAVGWTGENDKWPPICYDMIDQSVHPYTSCSRLMPECKDLDDFVNALLEDDDVDNDTDTWHIQCNRFQIAATFKKKEDAKKLIYEILGELGFSWEKRGQHGQVNLYDQLRVECWNALARVTEEAKNQKIDEKEDETKKRLSIRFAIHLNYMYYPVTASLPFASPIFGKDVEFAKDTAWFNSVEAYLHFAKEHILASAKTDREYAAAWYQIRRDEHAWLWKALWWLCEQDSTFDECLIATKDAVLLKDDGGRDHTLESVRSQRECMKLSAKKKT
jgi:hypothetical protein